MTEHPVHVLVFARLEAHHLEQIRAVDPRVRVSTVTDRTAGLELAADADVMVGWDIPREVVQRASRLRWIHSTAAGVDQLLHPEVCERDIVVTSSSGIHPPLVEHVFAFMLALSRRLHVAVRLQLQKRWDRRRMVGDELAGRTLGILGLGTIGREIAARARAFDMRVVGTKRTPAPVPGVERVLPPEGLPEVLREADVVVVTLPLTPQTRGLLGEAEFRMMKPSALFINVGRGAVVREDALVRALREGWIAAAALDVFEHEPLPADSPLYDLENVILTPHVSGTSPRYMDRAVPLFCENLRRFLTGQPLLNLVDKERGY
ncbi:MAG: D-2-hydroxyacid dehydrogenase [Armatimonadota bacterium]|nr:D-2-hydroxyacid dehydrogenase [Armatimonadota bacterium]MDR7437679.1 D-2-hydroxyacid dehydrogenase [Armatimonadota bacterium]MDR7507532.1 D-2-hydroxyacid dehydrogenase [Armatimonadota bacterium]MDR7582955.1 D-2-hydroxyacid dehydrogenase [Armatimonadota bacterium]